jgi:multidrug efflux pump subunit AcrA (membrane-fusion protein)
MCGMSRPFTIILAVLCAGAIVAVVLVVGPDSSSSSAAAERTVTVTKGVVQSTVSGSGNLAPAQELDLNFGVAGTVKKVYVKEGDKVTKGQVLAKLDDADAQVALDQAQASLDSAQADLAAARNETVADTGDDQVTYLTVADETTTTPQTTTTTTPPATTTPQTTPTTTTPQTQTTTTPTQPSATTTSRGSSSQGAAQQGSASAASPSSGASSSGSSQTAAQKAAAIATAQANADKAKLDVQDAQQDLDDTVLRAPTSGTVTAVSGAAGDSVSAGSSGAGDQSAGGQSTGSAATSAATGSSDSASSSGFISLAKLDRMQLSVSFTESDIGQVKVGQAATVSLSALSDVKLAGRVTQVAAVGTSSNGVVSYPVTILLDQNARGVKAGMTATAEVIVKQASGLTLPSQAVTGRGTTGIVRVEQDGETVTKTVGIGLQGDSSTLITSGLSAGDEVVIQSTPAITGGGASSSGQSGTSGLSQRFGGGGGAFPAGGGGGFPGGGSFGGGFARPGG